MKKRLAHDEIIMAVLDASGIDNEEALTYALSVLWLDKRFRPAVKKVCEAWGVDVNEVKGGER